MHSEVTDMRELAKAADRLHQSQEAMAEVNKISMRRGTNKSSTSSNRELCFYHAKYKTKARKCVPPCDWKPDLNDKKSENDQAGLQ